jgi:hypothetical protein
MHTGMSSSSKRLKTEAQHAPDKGKATTAPSSPSNDSDKSVSSRMHLRDNFSHVISEIRPKGSTQPKAISERSKGDSNNKGRIASQTGKIWILSFCLLNVEEQLTPEFLDNMLFFGYNG